MSSTVLTVRLRSRIVCVQPRQALSRATSLPAATNPFESVYQGNFLSRSERAHPPCLRDFEGECRTRSPACPRSTDCTPSRVAQPSLTRATACMSTAGMESKLPAPCGGARVARMVRWLAGGGNKRLAASGSGGRGCDGLGRAQSFAQVRSRARSAWTGWEDVCGGALPTSALSATSAPRFASAISDAFTALSSHVCTGSWLDAMVCIAMVLWSGNPSDRYM